MLMKQTFKLSALFAIAGYLIALGLFFAPVTWSLRPGFVFAICPPALLSITVDPSFPTVALILAPLNALIYGVVGMVIGVIADGISVEIRFWQ